MDIDKLVIRNATKNDIEQIAKIKIDGWKNAYNNIVDSNYLDNMSLYEQIEKYSNSYSSKDIFVVESNNEVIAFCRVYDYDKVEFEDEEIDCEIREIYVRSDLKRMGIGGKLFNHVLRYFKEKNKKKLYLGVFENNYKSRKFYEKMGGIFWKKGCMKLNEIEYPIVSYLYSLK